MINWVNYWGYIVWWWWCGYRFRSCMYDGFCKERWEVILVRMLWVFLIWEVNRWILRERIIVEIFCMSCVIRVELEECCCIVESVIMLFECSWIDLLKIVLLNDVRVIVIVVDLKVLLDYFLMGEFFGYGIDIYVLMLFFWFRSIVFVFEEEDVFVWRMSLVWVVFWKEKMEWWLF